MSEVVTIYSVGAQKRFELWSRYGETDLICWTFDRFEAIDEDGNDTVIWKYDFLPASSALWPSDMPR